MSILSRIKDWLTGGKKSSAPSSKAKTRANIVSYYGGGGSRSGYDRYVSRAKQIEDKRKKEKQAQEETTKKLASIIDKKSGDATKAVSKTANKAVAKKAKTTPPKAKVSDSPYATKSGGNNEYYSRNTAKKTATKPNTDPFKGKTTAVNAKADDPDKDRLYSERRDTYGVDSKKYKYGTSTWENGRLKYSDNEFNRMKYRMENHPKIESFMTGLGSGATFGVSDVAGAALNSKFVDKEQAKELNETYEKNKKTGYEIAGMITGSVPSFGGIANPARNLLGRGVTKVAPKLAANATERLTAKVAARPFVQRAAKKAATRAVERGLIGEASKEATEVFAKNIARRIVTGVEKDIAINMTGGALMDASYAAKEAGGVFNKNKETGEIFDPEFKKNFRRNQALSYGLGGLMTIAPELRVGKGVLGVRGGIRPELGEVADTVMRGEAMNEAARDGLRRLRAGELPEIKAPRISLKPIAENADETAGAVAKAVPPKPIGKSTVADVAAQREAKNVIKQTDKAIATQEADEVIDSTLRSETANVPPRTATEETPNYRMVDDDIPFGGDRADYAQTGSNDRIPVDDIEQTVENDARQALHERAEQMAGEPLPKNTPPEAEPFKAETPPTKGRAEAYKAHEKVTGTPFEREIKGSTNDEIFEAQKRLAKRNGTDEIKKTSKVAASQFNAADSDAERAIIDKLTESGVLDYDPVRTRQMFERVSKDFKNDGEYWLNKIASIANGTEELNYKEMVDLYSHCEYAMAVLDKGTAEGAEHYANAFKVAKELASSSGQMLNIRRRFVHLTPAGKMDVVADDLARLLEGSAGFRQNWLKQNKGTGLKIPVGKYDRRNFFKAIVMDDPEMKRNILKLVEAKTPDAIGDAYAECLYTLNKNNPKTLFDVVQEVRYLNMLGNPKTHIRNIFGSAFFAPMRQVSNMIRGGIEDSIAGKYGMTLRTKHGGLSLSAAKEAWSEKAATSEAGKEAWAAFKERKNDILGGMKYENVMYKGRGTTKAGKALDAVADFNSKWLAKEDDFFRSKAFRENYIKSYNKLKKSGVEITDAVKKQIEDDAILESQIATFNEYNEFANWLNKATRNANNPDASFGAKWGARSLNAAMPFTKVPANIGKEAINYSPAGIALGIRDIRKAGMSGDVVAMNKAIDKFASGLTGTGIFGAGLFAGLHSDAFTTNAGSQDPVGKFKKQQGVQNYSVQIGDHSYTLDWLVPTSATFFSGVELGNQMKRGDFNILDFGGDWSQVMSRLVEPVMETSMLSGIYNIVENSRKGSGGDDDKQNFISLAIRELAQSYLNSMIPTVLGQGARTAYKSDKMVTGKDDWDYWRNSMKVKTGLAGDNAVTRALGIEPLGADTTAYGDVKNEKKDGGDYAWSVAKNFVLPTNISKVDLDEHDREKIKLYEQGIKEGKSPEELQYLFPKKQYKSNFSYGKKGADPVDVEMTPRQVSAYNQAKSTGGEEGMRVTLESIMFNRYEKDASGKRVPRSDTLSEKDKERLIKQFKGKSIRDVEKWLWEQPQFKNASPEEQKQVMDKLWSYSGSGKAVGSKRVGEQAVVKAQGGDVNEYNFKNELGVKKQKALLPAVASGLVTYEEAVDFARNAGKTYYYESEDGGGSSQTYYNKSNMLDYLDGTDYSEEKRAALYNAFKQGNAKEYGSTSRRGGRRGYRRGGYHRRGHGGSSKVGVNKTAPKVTGLKAGVALTPKTSRATSKRATSAQYTPQLQRVQAKIDLPYPKERRT